MLAALVGAERRTIAAAASHNAEIGLPFTLTRIAADTEVAICEMAMRGPGQIAELAVLARPEIGVITNVGEAHLELLGSREAIAAAKAELLAHVEVAVVPAGEPLLEPHLRDRPMLVTFGEEAGADVRIAGRSVRPGGMTVSLDVDGRTDRRRHQPDRPPQRASTWPRPWPSAAPSASTSRSARPPPTRSGCSGGGRRTTRCPAAAWS